MVAEIERSAHDPATVERDAPAAGPADLGGQAVSVEAAKGAAEGPNAPTADSSRCMEIRRVASLRTRPERLRRQRCESQGQGRVPERQRSWLESKQGRRRPCLALLDLRSRHNTVAAHDMDFAMKEFAKTLAADGGACVAVLAGETATVQPAE